MKMKKREEKNKSAQHRYRYRYRSDEHYIRIYPDPFDADAGQHA
jgi:hypothetical protein